jgi:hypothetical protein
MTTNPSPRAHGAPSSPMARPNGRRPAGMATPDEVRAWTIGYEAGQRLVRTEMRELGFLARLRWVIGR